MKVIVTIDNMIFSREVPDAYFATLRDILLVMERHTLISIPENT